MPESEFDLRVDAARKELKDPEQVTVQNGDPTSHPRFEVWHWGQSLCSQKVRTVLTEKEIEYRSNELSFREFENYRPGYVRLRMYAAGPENLRRLAVEHTMRTSVKTEGFDACVVPLLVDHDKRRAIVDSAKIISYIEREVPKVPLIPENLELAAAIKNKL